MSINWFNNMTDIERFFLVVNQFDYLKPYWDQVNLEIRVDKIKEDLSLLSTGERMLLCFLASVWNWSVIDGLKFDVVVAMSILDGEHRQVVIDWINNPYWP